MWVQSKLCCITCFSRNRDSGVFLLSMPSRNLIVSDKMQFPNGATASGGGGEIHHPGPWFPDERDGFISWLRAEFAAANAIIDSLCQHLRVVGEPGEYDSVIGRVHQRRVAWNSVLHMQQFFPISDVMLALQQVGWRRQKRVIDQSRVAVKEFKRSNVHSFGSRYGQVAKATKEIHNVSVDSTNLGANASVMGSKGKNGTVRRREGLELGHDVRKSDDKGLLDTQKVTDSSLKPSMNRDEADYPCTKSPSEDVKDEKTSDFKGSCNLSMGENSDPIQNKKEEGLIVLPKTFSTMEINSGKTVNIAEGLNLYEKLLDDEEVSKLISLVDDLRATGKRGQLPGPTFVASRIPYRGHGREMIQLGIAISDVSSDDNPAKDWRVEPIPDLLQSLIDRLISMQLTPTKPDSCIIDIYNEGDCSQPRYFPLRYGRPICLLSLNDCDMVFGATIPGENGAFRGALNLALSPGSLLVMQGNSTDMVKHAIPSIPKHRILITFLKPQRSKVFQGGGDGDGQHLPLQASNWGPRPNHIPYTTPLPTTGVLPAPPIRAPLLFAPPPGPTPPMPFPSMALSTGWPTSTPRHPPPRGPVSGTGVFLPVETKIAGGEMNSTVNTTKRVETENDEEEVSDD